MSSSSLFIDAYREVKRVADDSKASETSETFDTDGGSHRTAILLLDFQNEFAKKGGKLHASVSETMDATGILQVVPQLVERARYVIPRRRKQSRPSYRSAFLVIRFF